MFNLFDDSKKGKHLAYRLRMNIEPDWRKLVSLIFNDKKEEICGQIEKGNVEIDELSLYGKQFSFVYFIDQRSGMKQIWSDHYKTFVDDTEIRGALLHVDSDNENKVFDKYVVYNMRNYLAISPFYIGYWGQSPAPDLGIREEDKVAEIPVDYILYYLEALERVFNKRYDNMAMRAIKKFPDELQKKLDECKVKYENWSSNNYAINKPFPPKDAKKIGETGFVVSKARVDNHYFVTEYYSLSINIQFFSKWLPDFF